MKRSLGSSLLRCVLLLAVATAGCGGGSGDNGGEGGEGGDNQGGEGGDGEGGGGGGDAKGGAGGGAGKGGSGGGSQGGSGGGSQGGSAGTANGGAAGTANGGAAGMANGGAAGAGTGGAAGMTAFSACPASGNCKILALGDDTVVGPNSASGEYGYRGMMLPFAGAGYRNVLLGIAKANNKTLEFVGSQSGGTGADASKKHEGRAGAKVETINGLLPNAVTSTSPHVVVLSVGVHDIKAGTAPAMVATGIAGLVDKIVAAAPNALVAVTLPPPGHGFKAPQCGNATESDYSKNIKALNTAIRDQVLDRTRAGKHVAVVDVYGTFVQNLGCPGFGLHYCGQAEEPCGFPKWGLIMKDVGYGATAQAIWDWAGKRQF